MTLESPEGKQPAQLSLQVTMLDTDMRGPRGAGGEGGAGGAGGGGGGAGKTLRCSVLVHSAANLPTGAADDGQGWGRG